MNDPNSYHNLAQVYTSLDSLSNKIQLTLSTLHQNPLSLPRPLSFPLSLAQSATVGARRFPQALGERERERERDQIGLWVWISRGLGLFRMAVQGGCAQLFLVDLLLCRGGFGRMVVCVVVLLRPWIHLAPSPIFFEFGLSFVFLFNQSLTRAMHGKAFAYKDINCSFSLPL